MIHSSLKMTALVFAIAGIVVIFTAGSALGMGANPSTCENRYDGNITSLTITYEGNTFDPIANPGITFEVENDKSYTVNLVIHTPSVSSNGNSADGTAWYHTSAPGYWMGYCVNNAGPDQDIRLELPQEHSGSIAQETTQKVSWATLGSDNITYNVKWTNPNEHSNEQKHQQVANMRVSVPGVGIKEIRINLNH